MYCRLKDLKGRGFGPYPVTVVENYVVPLKDGTKIAMKVWFPSLQGLDVWRCCRKSAEWIRTYCHPEEGWVDQRSSYPAIMEYLPYSKSLYTMQRDHLRHPWMASHGYVVLRPDMRGTGESTGFYFDEYAEQEQRDACEILGQDTGVLPHWQPNIMVTINCDEADKWIADQPWSNGRVGMFGKSWGGFNGLQVASCQPPALKAVISIYSTDNRFTDDIHARGGCILGAPAMDWAQTMFGMNCRPPHPEMYAGGLDDVEASSWKSAWRRRLEIAGAPWTAQWLQHQTYDGYFKHGSICEDYQRVRVPVLAVGGWHDMYSNAVFRLVEQLPDCRAIIGPWSHDWPDVAIPGPKIRFLGECLEFWNRHLMDGHPAGQVKPDLIWYQCRGVLPPAPSVDEWPGKWMMCSKFKAVHEVATTLTLKLTTSNPDGRVLQLVQGGDDDLEHDKKVAFLEFDLCSGLTAGALLSFGDPDLPADQRLFGSLKNTWSTEEALDEPLDIFGFPTVTLEYTVADAAVRGAQLTATLGDIFPDEPNPIRLLSNGTANLATACRQVPGNGREEILGRDLGGSEVWRRASIQLDAVGYQVQPGHRLNLKLSPAYWPQVWPADAPLKIGIRNAVLSLPTLIRGDATGMTELDLGDHPNFVSPASPTTTSDGPPMETLTLEEPRFQRRLIGALSDGSWTVETVQDSGTHLYLDAKTVYGHRLHSSYTVGDVKDPLSVLGRVKGKINVSFGATAGIPGGPSSSSTPDCCQEVVVETDGLIWTDGISFNLKESVEVSLNKEPFFVKEYQSQVPRIHC